MLGKYKLLNFYDLSFFVLLFFLSFFKISKTHLTFLSFFLSFFPLFFSFLSSQVSQLLRLLICLLSFLFSFDVASYESHDSFFFTSIFSFFNDYNKKRQRSHLPFFLPFFLLFLSFLNIVYRDTDIHTQHLCFILLEDYYDFIIYSFRVFHISVS